jgi:hypothetical protein
MDLGLGTCILSPLPGVWEVYGGSPGYLQPSSMLCMGRVSSAWEPALMSMYAHKATFNFAFLNQNDSWLC